MRLALALLALAAVLVAASVAVGPRVLGPERLQALAVDRLEQALDARLTAIGHADAVLLPRPHLRVEGAVVEHAAGRLVVERATVHLRLAPLLRGRATIASLTVDGFALEVAAADLAAAAASAPFAVEATRGRVRLPGVTSAEVQRFRLDQRDVAERRVEVEGLWRERPLTIDATLRTPGPRLERLSLELGRDRLVFAGRLDGSGAHGELELETEDLAALRATLPALPLPALADAVLAAHERPLRLQATVSADRRRFRLDELLLRSDETTATGALVVADGRIDLALESTAIDRPLDTAARALGLVRRAPDLLVDVERIALDAPGLRLRLERGDDGLDTALRLDLEGGTSLTVEGATRLDPLGFEGPLTLVGEDVGAALPEGVQLPWEGPVPASLQAHLEAAEGRVALTDMQLSAPRLGFLGSIFHTPEARPAIVVAGTVERLRLPGALPEAGVRGDALRRLWTAADRGGAMLDLDLRRVELGGTWSGNGRLIAELARDGLWLTALEIGGRGFELSMTGGLHREPERLDAIGAAELGAPGRLLDAVAALPWLRLDGLGPGRFDATAEGPLDRVAVAIDADLNDLDLAVDGRFDLLAHRWRGADLTLTHPDGGGLLRALGALPSAAAELGGPLAVEARYAPSDGAGDWRGGARLGGLDAAFEAGDGGIVIEGLGGPAASVGALARAVGGWPEDLERWRQRVQGDWPRGPVLASGWPEPFAIEVASDALVDTLGRPVTFELSARGDSERVVVDTFLWDTAVRRYRASGSAERGVLGVDVQGSVAFEDALDAPLARALGLGWLAPGRIEADADLRSLGATPRQLAAALMSTTTVAVETERRAVRLRNGRLHLLPPLALEGVIDVANGSARLDQLTGERARLTGEIDLYGGLVAATLATDEVLSEGGTSASISGRLDAPSWRHVAP